MLWCLPRWLCISITIADWHRWRGEQWVLRVRECGTGSGAHSMWTSRRPPELLLTAPQNTCLTPAWRSSATLFTPNCDGRVRRILSWSRHETVGCARSSEAKKCLQYVAKRGSDSEVVMRSHQARLRSTELRLPSQTAFICLSSGLKSRQLSPDNWAAP